MQRTVAGEVHLGQMLDRADNTQKVKLFTRLQ